MYMIFYYLCEFCIIFFLFVSYFDMMLPSSKIFHLEGIAVVNKSNLSSMNITGNYSQEFVDISNLSYLSAIGAVPLVAAEIQSSLGKLKKCLQDVNQSIQGI